MKPTTFWAKEIIENFKSEILVLKGNQSISFETFCTAEKPQKNAIAWVPSSNLNDFLSHVNRASFIVTDNNPSISDENLPNDVLIVLAKKPKLLFIKILAFCFQPKPVWGKHPSAVISPEANIHDEVFIGPNCYIGKANISKGCILEGNNFIYDNVTLKENVILQAGAIVGSKGMSMARDENGLLHNFPSLGEVVVEENCEIGSNSVIDAAVMGKTIIGKGTKINSLTFIGNSAEIGEHNYISVCVNVNGSVKIGDRNFIGSGSSIRNKAVIGNDNTIASGAIVVKNVSNNVTVMGNPAKENPNAKNLHL